MIDDEWNDRTVESGAMGVAPIGATADARDVIVVEAAEHGIEALLQAAGVGCRRARSGIAAMGLCKERAPTLVLCAPPSDLEERRLLAAALRARFPAVPLAYASRFSDDDDERAAAADEGAVALLPLPATPQTLRAVLGTWLPPTTTTEVPSFPPPSSTPDDEGLSIEEDWEAWGDATRPVQREDMSALSTAADGAAQRIAAGSRSLDEWVRLMAPFLWSLDDAAAWAGARADAGDDDAVGHAKTLEVLSHLLREVAGQAGGSPADRASSGGDDGPKGS